MKTIRRIIFACITIWVLAVTVAPKYDKQINAIFEKVLGHITMKIRMLIQRSYQHGTILKTTLHLHLKTALRSHLLM